MYLLILFLPFSSFLIASCLGRYIGRKGSVLITVTNMFLVALLSTLTFYEVALAESNCYIQLATWIDSAMLHASWGLLFDPLASIMTIVVSYVSAVVHLYSVEYMSHDPHLQRFMSYLSLFTFFMLILVTADNFIQMFIGWEGVGLASFLLINFWTTRLQANKAAMKALIVNRVGDFGLSLGMLAIFLVFGAVDYSTVFSTVSHAAIGNNYSLSFICFFLFFGAVGKSAQIGLHTWLPDAMEGPTPVSALIHAATMVTAGVFLVVRCSPIFEYAPNVLTIMAPIGAITSFFAATTGAFQNDLKRVIAYSTCSQLGYMIFACGISCYSVTMFHLMNHAFFKALLFLSAGSIIHSLVDEQDMRKMGALNRLIPFTYTMILIGSLALIGFPFLTGYYSKDFILELAAAKMHITGNIAYWLGTLSVSFTTFYSYRLVFLTFLNKNNSFKKFVKQAHELNPISPMAIPLALLAFASIFIGYFSRDMIVGVGTGFWGNSITILSENVITIEAEYLPYHIKMIPLVFSHIGIFIAYNFTFMGPDATKNIIFHQIKTSTPFIRLYTFFSSCWNFDNFYNRFIVQKFISFGYHTSFRLFDAGWIAYLGPYGLSGLTSSLSKRSGGLQSGHLYHYAYLIVLGVVSIFALSIYQPDSILYFIFIFTFISQKKIW